MSFLPRLSVNPAGWGPTGKAEDIFPDIPYAPFSKGDKLGKAADWTQRQYTKERGGVATAFNDFNDEDEEDYSLVDNNKVTQKKTYNTRAKYFKGQNQRANQPRSRGGTNWQQQQRTIKGVRVKGGRQQPRGQQVYMTRRWNWQNRSQRKFTSCVEVQPHWGEPISTIEFSALLAAKVNPPQGQDLRSCGKLERYNEAYNKLTIRHERPLERREIKFYQVTTSDDPVILELAQQSVGNVYATDAILAVLMSCLKSTYSWDIIARKKGNDLFLDKRDNSNFEYLTVNENASDPPLEENPENSANSLEQLHKEATFLNYSFSQQLLFKDDDDKALKFPHHNPFQSSPEERVASVAYRYRKWDFDGIQLVARTEVDGYQPSDKNAPRMLLIKALNEYDPKITGGWRKQLESQKASVFATEVKNNGIKLAKWAIQAHLAKADEIKLGFVSRANFRDAYSHVILSVTSHEPEHFTREIGVDIGKMWGVLKIILQTLRQLEEGKYIILRDPSKKQLVIYKVAIDEFEKKPN